MQQADLRMLAIGRGNSIPRNKVAALLHPDSSPVKRLLNEKREIHEVIDATRGSKTRSVIVLDNGFLILSSFTPETISNRYEEE